VDAAIAPRPERGRADPGPEWAVVVAAGSGTRFGRRKQYALLRGETVLARSVRVAVSACDGVVVVAPAEDVVEVSHLLDPLNLRHPGALTVVAGGATRSASVRAGLAAVPPAASVVAVHDAARPLADLGVWARVLAAVRAGADAAIPVVAVTDTIKQRDGSGRLRTLDRSQLVAVQTPQAFRAAVLRAAHEAGADATDDAALVEALGAQVAVVEGAAENLKITVPADLLVAEVLLG
jgi:2-C-methyl-D-erythritol 4-phosphate cytidylyltransferase